MLEKLMAEEEGIRKIDNHCISVVLLMYILGACEGILGESTLPTGC